jgi:T-complex protein 1 subunit beta
VGDGTTTVAVLAGELLREAEKMVNEKVHPQVIIQGWRLAKEEARRKLISLSRDNSANPASFREDLLSIARTTLSSKLLDQEKELFSELAVDAVMRLHGSGNLDYIQIIKKPGGNLKNSFLADGFILEKTISTGCPKVKVNPKIMVANTPMDYDKIKIFGSKVKADSIERVGEIE